MPPGTFWTFCWFLENIKPVCEARLVLLLLASEVWNRLRILTQEVLQPHSPPAAQENNLVLL